MVSTSAGTLPVVSSFPGEDCATFAPMVSARVHEYLQWHPLDQAGRWKSSPPEASVATTGE
jgi:hypothetical protein